MIFIGISLLTGLEPQLGIREKLKNVYDRLEIMDILCYLLATETLRCEATGSPPCIEALDPDAEPNVLWFVREEAHWFSV